MPAGEWAGSVAGSVDFPVLACNSDGTLWLGRLIRAECQVFLRSQSQAVVHSLGASRQPAGAEGTEGR